MFLKYAWIYLNITSQINRFFGKCHLFLESFNGSLRDELLNEEMFDSQEDARRELALWRYDYNKVRPHLSLRNQTPAQARRKLEQFEGSAPNALAQTETDECENQTRKLSL